MAEQPTDVRSVLQSSQDVLDAAVATVTATRKTQNTLEQNIYQTNQKIGEHNTSPEAHEDIRQQLSNLIDTPDISGPNSAEYGEEASWILSAVPLVNFINVEKFIIKLADGTREEVVASDNGATWKHTFYGDRNSTTTFSVQAYGAGFYSKTVTREVLITHHLPPDMTDFYCSLPEIINGGSTYTFRISGITDMDDDLKEITASTSNPKVVLSKTSALEQNVDYTLTVDNSLTSTEDVTVTFKATDNKDLFTTSVVRLHINGVPNVSNFSSSLPARLVPGSVVKLRVDGVVDPETSSSDGITYSVSSTSDKIIFSKASGIAIGEDVTVSVADDAAQGDAYSLIYTFLDKDSGTTTKTIVSSFNVAPNLSGIDFKLPTKLIPGKTYTITMTGATDVDGDTLIYSVSDIQDALTFSKTAAITDGEKITIKVSADAARGSNYTFKVNATDTNGATSSRIFTVSINRIILSSDIVSSLGDTFTTEPGKTYTVSFTPLKDSDSQTLTYTYKFDNSNVKIASQTSTSLSFTGPTEAQLARGETYKLTVTANDGFESVSKDFTVKQNELPNVTNFKVSYSPAYLTAGKSCTLSISGITEPNNEAVTLSLSSSSSLVTFSPTSGNIENTTFKMIADASINPGTQYSVIFTFTDKAGGVSTVTKTYKINQLPVVSGVKTTGLPTYLVPGKSYSFAISNITDPENQNISLKLSNLSSGISISKLNPALGESITYTVNASATRGGKESFTITATDTSGASASKTISIPVNQLIAASTITSWAPKYRLVYSSSNFQQLSHKALTATDADKQTLTYTISSNSSNLKFAVYDTSTSSYGTAATSVTISKPATQQITCYFDQGTTTTSGEAATVTVKANDGFETVTGTVVVTARPKAYVDSYITWASLPTSTVGNKTYNGAMSWTDPNGFTNTVLTAVSTPAASDTYKSQLKITLPSEPMSSGGKPTVVVPKVAADQKLSAVCTFRIYDSWNDSVLTTWTKTITVTPIYITRQTSITYPTAGVKVEYYNGFTVKWNAAVKGIDTVNGEINA